MKPNHKWLEFLELTCHLAINGQRGRSANLQGAPKVPRSWQSVYFAPSGLAVALWSQKWFMEAKTVIVHAQPLCSAFTSE